MKRKNAKDKLENLFRSYFNDGRKGNQPEGWNVPSDDVWAHIQQGLKEQKQPQRKFLYWHWVAAAASILLLISIFQLYQSNQQIQALSKQLTDNNQAVQKIQADLQVFIAAKAQEQQKTPSRTNVVTNNEQKGNPAIYTNKDKTLQETTVFNNANAVDNSTYAKIVTASSPNSNLGEVSLKKNLLPNTIQKRTEKTQIDDSNPPYLQKETALSKLSPLPHLTDAIHPLELPIAPINWKNTSITPILKKQPRFYITADYAPVWNIAKSKGFQFGKHNFYPKREVQKTAHNAGLQFGIKWHKGWSVETGLRYNRVNTIIRHNKRIPYKFLQEKLTNNGYYESKVNLALGSSRGTLETNISLGRASVSVVEETTNLNMETTFASDISHLDIPLILKKEWTIGPLALSTKVGFLNRFLLARSFELQEITIDDTRFNPTTIAFRERKVPKSINNFSAHYLVGLGVAYQFRPGFSFYVEPTFTRSMGPVVGVKNASIFLESSALNIGFRYWL